MSNNIKDEILKGKPFFFKDDGLNRKYILEDNYIYRKTSVTFEVFEVHVDKITNIGIHWWTYNIQKRAQGVLKFKDLKLKDV